MSHSRERLAVITAISLALLYHVITFPFPFLPDEVGPKTVLNNENKNETVGCLDSYNWCGYTKKVPFWLYAITNVICMSLAFPILNISMSTLFSKILGNRKQVNNKFFNKINAIYTLGNNAKFFLNGRIVCPYNWSLNYDNHI